MVTVAVPGLFTVLVRLMVLVVMEMVVVVVVVRGVVVVGIMITEVAKRTSVSVEATDVEVV